MLWDCTRRLLWDDGFCRPSSLSSPAGSPEAAVSLEPYEPTTTIQDGRARLKDEHRSPESEGPSSYFYLSVYLSIYLCLSNIYHTLYDKYYTYHIRILSLGLQMAKSRSSLFFLFFLWSMKEAQTRFELKRKVHTNYPWRKTEASLRTSKPEIAASTIWLQRGSVVLLDLVVLPLPVSLLLVSVFPTLLRDTCSLAVHPCPPGKLENKTSGQKHAINHGPLRLFADR